MWETSLIMFCMASMTGLAQILKSQKKITARSVIAGMLYNGLFGIALGALWTAKYPKEPIWLPLGISVMIGLSSGIVNIETIIKTFAKLFNVSLDE